jgi:1-acyl-sn-glycerol-3-phosphate acyltransferase
MKIKKRVASYEEIMAMPKHRRIKPKKPSRLIRALLKAVSIAELKETGFTYTAEGMERLGKDEPALFLMNHSSFIDLKIASTILYPRPFNIVCTSDAFVGKDAFMRTLGCIPATKFVTDVALVRDMIYAVKELKSSVLMYPEASYSFDGTATPLPDTLGRLLKLLNVPLVMIKADGAFARDPLYNLLQKRKVKVSAQMSYVFSKEEIAEKSVDELNAILKELFTFDYFRWQQENAVTISESFRADGLERVLYKCSACRIEGAMYGKGIKLKCGACAKTWELTENGFLKAENGEDIFDHIPDWYAWQRRMVKEALNDGTYLLDTPVEISMLVNTDFLYEVGSGHLRHSREGFRLTGCDGKLTFAMPPIASYGLYADFFWYELGDIICIGDNETLYYCFPEKEGIVAKTRIAVEELFKMTRKRCPLNGNT